jgi:hypothetical protein
MVSPVFHAWTRVHGIGWLKRLVPVCMLCVCVLVHSFAWFVQVDIMAFDEEIDQCENSTALWTDSSRIHGAPQRYAPYTAIQSPSFIHARAVYVYTHILNMHVNMIRVALRDCKGSMAH